MDIANTQNMILNMGAPIKAEQLIKKETVNSLITQISMNFQEDLFHIPPKELEFLIRMMGLDFEVVNDITEMDCYFIHSLGYIYLYDFNEQIYPIIPKELRKLYEQIPQEELEYQVEQSTRLYMYATALVQLYGIYTVEQFLEVWNSHQEEALSFDEASMYFYMIYDRQNYFGYDYEYVVADYFQDNEGYQLLEKVKDKPYYMPTKSEIEAYSQGSFDETSPHYQNLKKFINSYGCMAEIKVEGLVGEIAHACVMDQPFQEVMGLLKAYDLVVNNEEDMRIFEDLYAAVNNHTRKLILRGFTLAELFGESDQPLPATRPGQSAP